MRRDAATSARKKKLTSEVGAHRAGTELKKKNELVTRKSGNHSAHISVATAVLSVLCFSGRHEEKRELFTSTPHRQAWFTSANLTYYTQNVQIANLCVWQKQKISRTHKPTCIPHPQTVRIIQAHAERNASSAKCLRN